VGAIRARRGGELLTLDRLLLWSEPVAEAWNLFMGSMRAKLSLSDRFRELAICCVALFTGADYEYKYHSPAYLAAGGSPSLLKEIQRWAESRSTEWREPESIDGKERAIVFYAVQLTQNAKVEERVFADLKTFFSETQLVELTVLIGAYNMSARLLGAMDVRADADDK